MHRESTCSGPVPGTLARHLVALLTGLVLAALPAAQGRVLIAVLDDVATEDLAEARALGLTPRLDALAAQGTTFSAARANGVCSPSRSSLVTGYWYAGSRGSACQNTGGDPIPPGSQSIANLSTQWPVAIVGKWHLGRNPTGPWERAYLGLGFEQWLAGSPNNVLGCGGSGYSNWLRVDNGQISMSRRYEPIQAVQSAERWWAERAGPRLLLFTPQLAHGPMHVPPAELLPEGYEVGSGLRERYLAMIGALDTIVGRTLDLVDPRVDLVIVVGDNGTPQQVAPDPERAKTTTFERGVRVPLIVAGPGFRPGYDDPSLRHMADILPTVASFWGVPVAEDTDGRALQGPPPPAIVVTGEGDLAAVGWDLKLRRTAEGEQLFDLRVGEDDDVRGQPEFANQEGALRALIDAFEAR